MHLAKWRVSSLISGVSLAAFLISAGVPAWSQTASSGAVSGQVTDQQNAVIPGSRK